MLKEVVGEEKANELKALKESGASPVDLGKKIEEFLAQVTDAHKKEVAQEYGPSCRKLFGVEKQRRRKRGGEGHTLEDYFQSHLSWLTDPQKEELKQMKAGGKSRSEIQAKIMEYFDAATGEIKEKATQLLQAGCRHLLKSIVGEDKTNELKALKESGVAVAELEKKVQEMLGQVEDETKKAKAREFGPACKKIFEAAGASRKRRDRLAWDNEEEQDVNEDQNSRGRASNSRRNGAEEEHVRSHHSWLTTQQKGEIEQMQEQGHGGSAIHEKILEFFHISGDDVKDMARNLLTSGCEKLLESLFGQEKAAEIQEMRQQGASQSEIEEKVRNLAENIEDEDRKAEALKYGSTCRKIFTLLMRKRRTPPTVKLAKDHHRLNHHLKTHLMWLSYGEKEELRRMKEEGASRKELQLKVAEFFERTQGERRHIALEHFKTGCQELLYSIVGEYRPNALRSIVKSEGTNIHEINYRVARLIEEMEENGQWKETQELGPACRKALQIKKYQQY